MKRIITFAVILIAFIFPIGVNASGTDTFLSQIEILDNGSIKVRELIKLDGDFNGMYREVHHKNSSSSIYNGNINALEGNSSLYDGDYISDVRVGSISDDGDLSFDDFSRSINYFTEVLSANSGEYHKYIKNILHNGVYLKLFNPSYKDEIFYIEYVISNVIVIHNDIAEFAFNTLGDGYTENIDNYQVKVILPGEDIDYRVWLHGPLNGNIRRINSKEALGIYDFLGAYNPVSVRLIFDKSLVLNSTKYSNLTAKDKIIEIQTELAEEANRTREKIRMQNMIIIGSSILWAIISIVLVILVFIRSKASKKTDFNMQYFRDFPGEYGPESLEFLLNKNVSEESLSANILSLVSKKVLKVEKIEKSKKEDYKLVLQEYDVNSLTEVEKIVLDLMINEVGNSKEVVLSNIKRHCSKLSNAQSFIDKYNDFIRVSKATAKSEEFYLRIPSIVYLSLIFFSLGVLLMFIAFAFELIVLAIIILVLIFVFYILVLLRKFYTKKGALHYAQWMAHKNFLEDFSRFDEKELPEVILWDKYLVYATVLGCADKLSKEMKIKVDNMNIDGTYTFDPVIYHHYFMIDSICDSINKGVHSAVASSRSSIAASQSSSGGGFGGGSIGGGGSFGGGGGGGRF